MMSLSSRPNSSAHPEAAGRSLSGTKAAGNARAFATPAWAGFFPSGYLREYYSTVAQDERRSLDYLVSFLRDQKISGDRLLEFGCGPTVHRAIAAAPRFEGIVFSDLLAANLEAISGWLARRSDAFDWSPFTRYVLEAEGPGQVSGANVLAREELTRRRTEGLLEGDARRPLPVGPTASDSFDAVFACYCLEAVGPNERDFAQALQNVLHLVRPGGFAVVMTLEACARYRLNGYFVPCYPVRESDLLTGYRSVGFEVTDISHCEASDHANQGYTKLMLSCARRLG